MMFVYFLIVGTRMSATKRKEMSKKNKDKKRREANEPKNQPIQVVPRFDLNLKAPDCNPF